mmetsp:Transcript_31377/g.67521  ORF Transcript_31377/g.67521 Transcript_31377/m.67521 type:complete len:290 (+) Transcript_31377:189-1058(+)
MNLRLPPCLLNCALRWSMKDTNNWVLITLSCRRRAALRGARKRSGTNSNCWVRLEGAPYCLHAPECSNTSPQRDSTHCRTPTRASLRARWDSGDSSNMAALMTAVARSRLNSLPLLPLLPVPAPVPVPVLVPALHRDRPVRGCFRLCLTLAAWWASSLCRRENCAHSKGSDTASREGAGGTNRGRFSLPRGSPPAPASSPRPLPRLIPIRGFGAAGLSFSGRSTERRWRLRGCAEASLWCTSRAELGAALVTVRGWYNSGCSTKASQPSRPALGAMVTEGREVDTTPMM